MQLLSVFAVYVLRFIGSRTVRVILCGLFLGLVTSTVLLFANEMLLSSFFAAGLVAVWFVVLLEPLLEKMKFPIVIMILQIVLLCSVTIGVKFATSRLLGVADDEHIGDIFRSKFTDFKNFHTMLYTCAPEFDFMETATPGRILKTLLAPCALLSVAVFVFRLARTEYFGRSEEKLESNEENARHSSPKTAQNKNGHAHCTPSLENAEDRLVQFRHKENAEILYHVFQLTSFTAMAVIIMRLKLFWTPHLCLVSSLLASRQLFGWIGSQSRHYTAVGILIAAMSVQGVANLQHQWSIIGEFSNIQMEELVEWMRTNTNGDSVFAGPMPTMATVKLCTGRPIVNHPHYEDVGLRERTKLVYSMYSRKDEEDVWRNLQKLQVNFAILEDSWCTRRTKPGCALPEIWDLEDELNRGREPVCSRLRRKPGPFFSNVFHNDVYHVLEVLKEPTTGHFRHSKESRSSDKERKR